MNSRLYLNKHLIYLQSDITLCNCLFVGVFELNLFISNTKTTFLFYMKQKKKTLLLAIYFTLLTALVSVLSFQEQFITL